MDIREEQLHKERGDDKKIMPPYIAVRKMAFGITRAAFGVSSESVVTASKPRNEKQTIVAPVIIGIRCAFSLINGCRDQTVPTPSPLCSPLYHQNHKHHHDGDLHQHEQGIEVGHRVNAFSDSPRSEWRQRSPPTPTAALPETARRGRSSPKRTLIIGRNR